MPDTQATVVISAKVDNLLAGLRKGTAALTDFEKHGQKLSQGFKNFFSGFGLAQVSAAAAGAGLVAFGKASLKAASDVEELSSKAKFVFRESLPGVQKASQEAANEMGRARSQILGMAADFGAIIEPMGVANSKAAEMSVSFAKLAVDLSSFHNKSVEEAFLALRSGITGETEPMKRFGIVMTDTNLQAFALSKGITKLYKDMSQGEKTALRYTYVMEKTRTAQGDTARTAEGLANRTREVSARWTEFKEAVGEAFAPGAAEFLKGLANTIRDMTAAIIQFRSEVSQTFALRLAEENAAKVGGSVQPFEGTFVTDYTSPAFKARKGSLATVIGTMAKEGPGAATAAKSLGQELAGVGKAADALEKAKENMQELGKTYGETRRSISQDLKELELRHAEAMRGFAMQIDEATKSLQRLQAEYDRTVEGLDRQAVDKVLDQEEKIARIKEQITQEQEREFQVTGNRQDNEKALQLRAQLVKEEAALAAFKTQNPDLASQAVTEGGKTEFERGVEDINRRRADEKRQFEERYADQQKDIEKIKEKRTEEELTYGALRQQYASTQAALDAFYTDYTAKMADMRTVTEETAKAMKQALEDISNSISTTDAQALASSPLGANIAARREARNIPGRASGGPASGLTWVGERGPELVNLPNGSYVHNAKDSSRMLGGITIGSINVTNEADENRLIQKLTRLIQLQQLAST